MNILLQVLIEGVVGDSWAGDIAMDDIKFYKGVCPPSGKKKNQHNKDT